MTDISLKVLSNEIKMSIQDLIKELSNINIIKNENDYISKIEKNNLLKQLKFKKKSSLNAFTVQRKTRSTINIPMVGGKNKSIQIEIRKKRMYLKNNNIENELLSHSLKKNKSFLNKNIFFKNQENNRSDKLTKTKDIKKINNKNTDISEKNKINFEALRSKKINKLKSVNNFNKDEKNKRNFTTTTLNFKSKKRIKEKKDYNLKKNSIENEENRNINQNLERDTKNYNRTIKNYRQKRSFKISQKEKSQREYSRSGIRSKNILKQKNKHIMLHQAFQKPESIINRDVIISNAISVAELSNKMAVKSSEVIKIMMNMGIIGNINYILDQDTAQLIAEEMGHKVILRRENALEEMIMEDRDKGNDVFVIRAPVVTIMGHVDHGKTSLLDYIRSTKTAFYEAGGITQNIGAYYVNTDLGSITFLDTPGHSAFTAMRSRGVQITDIVVLVVAADDGVMPQTIEAIQHAKDANVPIIIAINKVDKTNIDIDKIKNDLTKYNILSEEWGGENIFIPISAKTGLGVDKLLQAILLQSEILELKAVSTGMAEGVVIESFLDKGRGPIATVLIKKGNLKKGDVILCGFEYGRVKALRDHTGSEVLKAGPSFPVEILGLSKVPLSGDIVTVVRNEKKAREVAIYRKQKSRDIKLSNQNKINLENMFDNINKNHVSELKIILKSDIQGTLEAISHALLKLSNKEVKIKIIGSGIGGITETDASLALASNAIILGFNVRADSSAKKIINKEHLDLRYYSVIYDLIHEVKTAMIGLLSPEYKQNVVGLAQVRNVFKSPKIGLIAGCMILEGVIKRNNSIRILRNNVVIHEGIIESLRRFKEDVNEIRNGLECGIGIKNYNDIRVEDIIEVFELKEIKRTL